MFMGSIWRNLPTRGVHPAYAAALALIAIQVSIGILFKAAQVDGKYAFSASSSVTISETIKFLLASIFYYRECSTKYPANSKVPTRSERAQDEEKEILIEDNVDQAFLKSAERVAGSVGKLKLPGMSLDVRTLYHFAAEELPIETRYGFALCALFYVLINNTVFLQYKLSDPGTIQLIKSGTTLVTALVSMTFLRTTILRGQWIAIALQVCGIVTTQYKPSGATYPLSTYMVLLFATTLSALSSVYNQKLCKTGNASMHVMNMALYSSGAVINLILHFITRVIRPEEPGFFTGYGSIGAILVIVNNVLIGLAMTAVYKYADAIVKCFATAISTAILLYLSPILFGVELSFLVLPGTTVVFIATWLYMEATPASAPATTTNPGNVSDIKLEQRSTLGKILYMLSPHGPFRNIGLGLATVLTLVVISTLTSWDYRQSIVLPKDEPPSLLTPSNVTISESPKLLQSPFDKTLAYVRWNSKHEDRIPLIKNGYEPFFQTVHYSMPDISDDGREEFVNLTHDAWKDGYTGYRVVKEAMQLLLNETSEAEYTGMMFFHFDVWLDPLGFADMDFDKIWFPDSPDPKFLCMKTTQRYKEWWGWNDKDKHHEKALQATRFAAKLHTHYQIDPDEWCIGWSDIYYIPRRYFEAFIELSNTFLAVPVFHEIAIPTILHIIDKTFEHRPSRSIISRLGDCWGNCCADGPSVEDIFWHRCGHRLDLLNQRVSHAHFRRLRQQSMMLGQPLGLEYTGLINGTVDDLMRQVAETRPSNEQ